MIKKKTKKRTPNPFKKKKTAKDTLKMLNTFYTKKIKQ